jgi:multidrug efflux pump subunit AcrA (membrane-fusion protein)
MMTTLAENRWRGLAAPAAIGVVAIALAGGAWMFNLVPRGFGVVPSAPSSDKSTTADDEKHDHDHPPGEDDHAERLMISPEARRNIGLELGQIARRDVAKSITLPGIVAEIPGRSHIVVTTHFTGIITKIHVAEGQAVRVGDPLFDLRLTHEELIQSQTQLLKTAQEMEIIDREIARLDELARDGGIARKTLLERKYERERHAADFVVQKQALLLHEMSEEQIEEVLRTKQLLGLLTIHAVEDSGMEAATDWSVLIVHDLLVSLGQHIEAGTTLAMLSDHAELLVEGEAFEKDAPALARALEHSWPVTLLPGDEKAPAASEADPVQVKLLYLGDKIDPQSRTFHFYARLTNAIRRDAQGDDGRRRVEWRYRPGERMRVQLPVEQWKEKLVVPVAALAQDGVETCVFRYVDGEFARTPVQVLYRDEQVAVLAEGGAVDVGQIIAVTAGQQLQFALANQAGAGVDPHAGHSH